MVEPEAATDVFAVSTGDGTPLPFYTSGFPVDMAFHKVVTNSSSTFVLGSRLTQGKGLVTSSTAAEITEGDQQYDYMTGWNTETSTNTNKYSWMWKRAKGYMDVVCYSGNGSARTVPHSLSVIPEMMWVKSRDIVFNGTSYTSNWGVYHKDISVSAAMPLNTGDRGTAWLATTFWNDTAPTATVFSLGAGAGATVTNNPYGTYIAYLFATLAGVSKVGSYTGNGSNQTIDCGFSAGARFILIKRTDDDGDWFFWDSVRGIVAGNDPHLSLNTTAAEVTNDDSVDPHNSGFIVNQVSATNINVSSGTYIFYAIA
jgi:hypothetical protein